MTASCEHVARSVKTSTPRQPRPKRVVCMEAQEGKVAAEGATAPARISDRVVHGRGRVAHQRRPAVTRRCQAVHAAPPTRPTFSSSVDEPACACRERRHESATRRWVQRRSDMQPSCRRAASIPGVSDDERPRSSSRARLRCSIGEAVRRDYCSCAEEPHVAVCVSPEPRPQCRCL